MVETNKGADMSEELTFEKFPSIKRLKRTCIISEKIDGTNGQIVFDSNGHILCGSRNKAITPEQDNYGFAAWAYSNKDELFGVLGEGRHYGEWWGQGIQRRYDMEYKCFSLFHTGRWTPDNLVSIPQLSVVPQLYIGAFGTDIIDETMNALLKSGSMASLGFNNPEGVVVYHSQIKQMFKITFEHDKHGKQRS